MRAWSIAIVALVGGCDTKASASDPQGAAPRPEQLSREYESCGTSAHCADDLRCLGNTCVRSKRSTVGDYFAAVGAAAHARGDHEAAIGAYASALGHYDAEKTPLPPDVDCAYGAALAGAAGKKENAELGARVLHRCLLASPVGSAPRKMAIAALATLNTSGLDPLLLGAEKTADLYLTKAPAGPALDKITVAVSALPQPKNFQLIADKLAEPSIKSALVGCWEQLHTAAKKSSLAATIGFKHGYVPSDYEDEPGRYVWKVEAGPSMPPGPEATADACVRGVIEPAVKSLKINESFSSKLTVLIK
ncbi:MAG TPA: hypothetical protein VM513_20650 [Kofleriaceae bacterium]|jgi:hypothetical protein|nr:hypothetical protein [Kofleriaceae bacterium]